MRYGMAIEFRLLTWGTEDDLVKRHHIQNLLDERLLAENNGETAGGDIGSGTMNVYLMKIVDTDRALNAVLDILSNLDLLDDVTIYRETPTNDNDGTFVSQAIWPRYKTEAFDF